MNVNALLISGLEMKASSKAAARCSVCATVVLGLRTHGAGFTGLACRSARSADLLSTVAGRARTTKGARSVEKIEACISTFYDGVLVGGGGVFETNRLDM